VFAVACLACEQGDDSLTYFPGSSMRYVTRKRLEIRGLCPHRTNMGIGVVGVRIHGVSRSGDAIAVGCRHRLDALNLKDGPCADPARSYVGTHEVDLSRDAPFPVFGPPEVARSSSGLAADLPGDKAWNCISGWAVRPFASATSLHVTWRPAMEARWKRRR
jgi:hypothetical protein